jgi:hypothetical protein
MTAPRMRGRSTAWLLVLDHLAVRHCGYPAQIDWPTNQAFGQLALYMLAKTALWYEGGVSRIEDDCRVSSLAEVDSQAAHGITCA